MQTEAICWRVGITGGIGSGKTTVCRIFQSMGVPVYHADDWAKWLITHDAVVKAGIQGLFGTEAYLPDGAYNRAFVAGIVFADKNKLDALNALVHPAVEQHSRTWHAERAAEGAPYTLREAALMIESGNYKHLDALILVTAPEDIRIQRVMERDQAPEAQVRARIASQMPEAEKIKYATFIIENDGDKHLIPQVLAIHHQILSNTF
jgi:dephospho-CoA kinase